MWRCFISQDDFYDVFLFVHCSLLFDCHSPRSSSHLSYSMVRRAVSAVKGLLTLLSSPVISCCLLIHFSKARS